MLSLTAAGLACEAGGFHIDPWAPVDRALVTHAHGDHLRWGSRHYLVAAPGVELARRRLPADASVEGIPYGERRGINGVTVSFHPAGHILGSAQVRVEHQGHVWVVSGDYKLEPDPTCAPFEPVRCHGFVTECTFGLPIYRWAPQAEVFSAINAWWRANQAAGRATLLMGYALGKAQRLLAGLDPSLGPIVTHGAVEKMLEPYRAQGIALPPTVHVTEEAKKGGDFRDAIVIAPPGSEATPWARRFGDAALGFASGWMQVRGNRRRQALDRGFVLSDHVDWPSLLTAIEATGAETIWATHGFTAPLVRYLREQGRDAHALTTRYEGERDDGAEA
ncbi:MAG: ligase-associated DNA damage response exonuclease [Gemmatimonadetes bacterium]|nr:ligase-associated DNA damage response exonuclease [Gemmatimonadota bacterium]